MAEQNMSRFEPARLLVVDDDPILREFAVANLTTATVTVETAENGEAGWQRLKKGGIDIALVDLEMPVMDGFDLITAIRGNDRLFPLPVVVATSRNDMEAIDRAYGVGATAFTLKPLNWHVVSYQLSYVLRNSREEARVRANARTLRHRLRAQDEVVSACQEGVDDLMRIILEDMQTVAASADTSAVRTWTRIFAEVDRLRADIQEKSVRVR